MSEYNYEMQNDQSKSFIQIIIKGSQELMKHIFSFLYQKKNIVRYHILPSWIGDTFQMWWFLSVLFVFSETFPRDPEAA